MRSLFIYLLPPAKLVNSHCHCCLPVQQQTSPSWSRNLRLARRPRQEVGQKLYNIRIDLSRNSWFTNIRIPRYRWTVSSAMCTLHISGGVSGRSNARFIIPRLKVPSKPPFIFYYFILFQCIRAVTTFLIPSQFLVWLRTDIKATKQTTSAAFVNGHFGYPSQKFASALKILLLYSPFIASAAAFALCVC